MTKVAYFHQQQNAKPDVALFTHCKQATEKCPKSVQFFQSGKKFAKPNATILLHFSKN